MKIVLAPDSFKGSLSAFEVAEVMKESVAAILPEAEIVTLPMADGGEGSLDCLLHQENSLKIPITVTGPLGKRIDTYYGVIDEKIAVIETAMINGLTLVPPQSRHPDMTTTYGVGEAILHALDRGLKSIIICTGGSATNDGGFGMLQALGMKAYNERGHRLGIYGKDLFQLAYIEWDDMDERVFDLSIDVVCDVDNPLLGKTGCSHIYGRQKGLSEKEAAVYDDVLTHFSGLVTDIIGQDLTEEKHTGSAGGLAFALQAIGGKVKQGAPFVGEAIGLTEHLKTADLVLTGEGRTDNQTLYGKAPGYVAALGKKYHIPVYLISGSLAANRTKLREVFSGCFSILNEPMTIERAMGEVEQLLYEQVADVIYMVQVLLEEKE